MNSVGEWRLAPISRGTLLRKAQALAWPCVVYHDRELRDEAAWRAAGLSNPVERRELFGRLVAIETERARPVARGKRR
jgi:hypothetical protein